MISCSTIRDNNGLALSSRNSMLNKKQVLKAGKIYTYLKENKKLIQHKILNNKKKEIVEKLIKIGAQKIDYIECLNLKKLEFSKDTKTSFNIFLAYYLSEVRVIDNL